LNGRLIDRTATDRRRAPSPRLRHTGGAAREGLHGWRPTICHGKVCIRGTRCWAGALLPTRPATVLQ